MAIKNIVLVGATGLVGSHLLRALSSAQSFSITLLVRPSSTSKQPEGFKILKYDFDDPALVEALRGQDAIVTALPNDAILSEKDLIDAAVKAGVRRFMPTEFASNTLNPVVPALSSWYRDKKTIHDYIVQVAEKKPGFTYAAIITGPFFTWGLQSGFLRYDLQKRIAYVYDGGSIRVSYSEISQAALAVVRSLERDITEYLYVSSVTCSQNEIIAALEKVSGEKWERKEESTKEAEEKSAVLMASGDEKTRVEGMYLRAMRWGYGADCGGDWGVGDNERLGLNEEKLEDLVGKALRGEGEGD